MLQFFVVALIVTLSLIVYFSFFPSNEQYDDSQLHDFQRKVLQVTQRENTEKAINILQGYAHNKKNGHKVRFHSYEALVSQARKNNQPEGLKKALKYLNESNQLLKTSSDQLDEKSKNEIQEQIFSNQFSIARFLSYLGDITTSISIKKELLDEMNQTKNETVQGFRSDLNLSSEYISITLAEDYCKNGEDEKGYKILDELIQHSDHPVYSKSCASFTKYSLIKMKNLDAGNDGLKSFQKTISIIETVAKSNEAIHQIDHDAYMLELMIGYLSEKWHYECKFDASDKELLQLISEKYFNHPNMSDNSKAVLIDVLMQYNNSTGNTLLAEDFESFIRDHPEYQLH